MPTGFSSSLDSKPPPPPFFIPAWSSFALHHHRSMASADFRNTYKEENLPLVDDEITPEQVESYHAIDRDPESWASTLPANQGLYRNDEEKDSCGVGFVCHIKGKASHKIVSDARQLLCAMTHRGATGADSRDGDGAGVMTAIPHQLFKREVEQDFGCTLPQPGEYAVGNLFFKPNNPVQLQNQQATFTKLAADLGLRVLGWREVPTDGSILGPASSSREPVILQPFLVLQEQYGSGSVSAGGAFDTKLLERQLYVLRKQATHSMFVPFPFISATSSLICVFVQYSCKGLLYMLSFSQQHRVQGPAFALASVQLLPRPEPRSLHLTFHTRSLPILHQHVPQLGSCSAHEARCSQRLVFFLHTIACSLIQSTSTGEINTVRGNKNWMRAREGVLSSKNFGDQLNLLYPIIEHGGSDSAAFDNVLELLVVNGVVTLPEAVMMLIPEAWQGNDSMPPEKKAFYNWAACLQEPWDGPALFTFSDGRYCGANLDRNGLRPCRYITTNEDIIICASEVGALVVPPEKVLSKGRLKPGRMLLVDTVEGRIVDDKELKQKTAKKQNFASWIESNILQVPKIMQRVRRSGISLEPSPDETSLSQDPKLISFGYTVEQLNLIMLPMVAEGKEALGSMGNDAPLAAMAHQPRLVYEYFRQLFAQVTNPPIDPIRESIVMSLETYVGPEGNLLEMRPDQCHRILLPSPLLTLQEMNAMKDLKVAYHSWPSRTIDITFPKEEGLPGYQLALERVCGEASQAIEDGIKVVILSDRAVGPDRVPLSALVAVGGVHHHLVNQKKRAKIALMVETAEAREVHHLCVLVGYGADAVCPWLLMEMLHKVAREGL